jgi:mannose-1-phosphate guanylyltransferase
MNLINFTQRVIFNTSKASNCTSQSKYLLTFGIKPTKLETGNGYLVYDGERVIAFHEKLNFTTATTNLDRGSYLWNSGLFCLKVGVFLAHLQKQKPAVYATSKLALEANKNAVLNYGLSPQIRSISVDFTVMELSKILKWYLHICNGPIWFFLNQFTNTFLVKDILWMNWGISQSVLRSILPS